MKTYHLFISHSWAHSQSYTNLVNLLSNRSYFDFHDYSVPKDDPIHTRGTDKALRLAIVQKMQSCSAVLILAGVYATYSKWINVEIDIAKNEFHAPKPIIAIELWGSERTSQIVKNNADIIVGWNTKSIVDAIRTLV